MKTLIVGAGNIGTAIAFYLVNTFSETVSLVDSDEKSLEKVSLNIRKIDSSQIQLINQNVFSESFFNKLINEYEIVISTLPWNQHVELCKILENIPIILIGVARPHYNYYQNMLVKNKSIKATIIHGCGLEPGLTEIFTQYLVKSFTKLNEVSIACGGIPEKPVPPLNYKLVFGGNNLPFQQRITLKIEKGRLCAVPRFGDVDEFFIASIGKLECWNDGLTPWLAEYLLKKRVDNCVQKTIRWPGYARIVDFLNQAGFLSDDVLHITKKILIPKLQLAADEIDIVIQHIHVKGLISCEVHEANLELIDYKDNETGLTAMARTTGFSTALIARFIWENGEKKSCECMLTNYYSNELFNYLYLYLRNSGMTINFNFSNEIKNVS